MKVYHGSYCPVEKPELIKSKFPKDFGEGFYCTELEQQAERWAKRYDTATVTIFEYRPDEMADMLYFKEMTEEWLDFIVDCRSGKAHGFDIVTGAMANDQIYNYISDFIDGVITREQFWVLAKFKYPTHQICFCSPRALGCLKYVECRTIKTDK
jgi:hypothetical protein